MASKTSKIWLPYTLWLKLRAMANEINKGKNPKKVSVDDVAEAILEDMLKNRLDFVRQCARALVLEQREKKEY